MTKVDVVEDFVDFLEKEGLVDARNIVEKVLVKKATREKISLKKAAEKYANPNAKMSTSTYHLDIVLKNCNKTKFNALSDDPLVFKNE